MGFNEKSIERKNAPKIWREPPRGLLVYFFILNQKTL